MDVSSPRPVLAERRGKQGGAVSTMHTVTAGAEGASSVRGLRDGDGVSLTCEVTAHLHRTMRKSRHHIRHGFVI
jgi:hypothetical protein